MQREKDGEILEPESPHLIKVGKGVGYNQAENSAVDILNKIHQLTKIALRLEGVQGKPNGKGLTKAGYRYSQTMTPPEVQVVITSLNQVKDVIAQQLGIWSIEKVTKDPLSDTLVFSWRFAPNFEEKENEIKEILELGTQRGFYITAHPGGGKTSAAIYLGQRLGGFTAMKLALNPHFDEKSSFREYGFYEINDMQLIIEQIYLLHEELELRRSDRNRRYPLNIIFDEWGAIKDAAEKPEELLGKVKRLSVEGRKLNINPIVIDHSDTVKASGLDTQFREAFYQLFLVGNARNALNNGSKNTRLKDWEKDYILNHEGYPALAQVNGRYIVVKHPTHHNYKEYKDKGNKPKNVEKMEVIPLTIKLAGDDPLVSPKTTNQVAHTINLSPEEEKLIEMAQKNGTYSASKATKCYLFKKQGIKKAEVVTLLEKLETKGQIILERHGASYKYSLKSQ